MTNGVNLRNHIWAIGDITLLPLFCHVSCKSCIGPLENQCLSCYENFNYFFDSDKNMCICKAGYFRTRSLENPDFTCQKCHITCLTCNGETEKNCLTCSIGYIIKNYTCEKSLKGLKKKYEFLIKKNL